MKRILASFCAATLFATGVAAVPAAAQSRDDQQEARKEMKAGNTMSVRDIERGIVPDMQRKGYKYLTFEYDPRATAYRLKFMRGERVVFVDVDARSGKVLRRTR